MSGPVGTDQTAAVRDEPGGPGLQVTAGRDTEVGGVRVRRALPQRARRTVGAWCFVDHLGPAMLTDERSLEIGPHPHTGLATVTWLLSGEQRHRDSLGSDVVIRPGQLNLMHAGHGVAHAEQSQDWRGTIHGVQLWVAQPEATRHGAAAFSHHEDLPQVELGAATATVLVGSLADVVSPARADTPLLGADLDLRPGRVELALDPAHEHALVVLSGAVVIGEQLLEPGRLGHLGLGATELVLDAAEPARVLLLGGEPLGEPLLMWWNLVARSREEVDAARRAWAERDTDRFGPVATSLPRIEAPDVPWRPRAAD